MIYTPKKITLTESAPETIDHYHLVARAADGVTELAGANYPINSSGVTEILIGSNGFFAPIADGTLVRLFLTSVAAMGHGETPPAQEAPGGPFTVTTLDDGAENIVVTV